MVIAFQLILLLIVLITIQKVIVEKEQKRQENFAFLCAIALALFFASGVWL
ncbi:hypothetical protein SAMN05216232_0198 [Virgibacillus subterraneus]|uniref:Uncharacterized protein n=1 Tax=Virgibacillus subterraneus TaxID=621109 RepID=A0A1H8Z0P3_9BACI|nr:hypothetical protein [Virgibacillus subterraneus]SEP57198.1 hypothetical protein SAMN05216232_0198 [Virgibacillus subterraneus]